MHFTVRTICLLTAHIIAMMYLVLEYIREINQFSRMAHLEMSQYIKENSISFGKERERKREILFQTGSTWSWPLWLLAWSYQMLDWCLICQSSEWPFICSIWQLCIIMLYICNCNRICEVRLIYENTWNLQVCLDTFFL